MASTPVLIVARSARMLAAAATPAYRPWAIDFFADDDLRRDCTGWRRLQPGRRLRFPVDDLLAAVSEVQQAAGPMPLVLGSGFERQPALVSELRARWPVAGVGAEVYSRLLDLPALFAALDTVQVPATSRTRPASETPWLSKRDGGTGGFHVRRVRRRHLTAPRGRYFQALAQGLSVSAVCLGRAVGTTVVIETFVHLAWRHGARDRYAYQGAMSWTPAPRVKQAIEHAAGELARELDLRGLFGLDFIAAPDGSVWLVDINPRPPATLDLCHDPGTLFALHLHHGLDAATVNAESPPLPRRPGQACRGHLLVYVEAGWRVPAGMQWPQDTADRPAAGVDVAPGAPLCTLRADAATPQQLQFLLGQRFTQLARVTNQHGEPVLPAKITISTVGGDHNNE